ncbi:MAG: hypothetical protein ACO2ZZ_04255 [Cyclobacteriaceae bacterium]
MKDSIYVQALNADKNGDWETAHELIQHLPTKEAAWIHAYLHRKEGDDWNARYWYDRASQPVFSGSLEDEWQHIFNSLTK